MDTYEGRECQSETQAETQKAGSGEPACSGRVQLLNPKGLRNDACDLEDVFE